MHINNDVISTKVTGSRLDASQFEALITGLSTLLETSQERYGEISESDRYGIVKSIVKHLPGISPEQLDEVDYMIDNVITQYNKPESILPMKFVKPSTVLEKRFAEGYPNNEECWGYETDCVTPEFLNEEYRWPKNDKRSLPDTSRQNFLQVLNINNARIIKNTRNNVNLMANNLRQIAPIKGIEEKTTDLRLILKSSQYAAREALQNPQFLSKFKSGILSQNRALENIVAVYTQIVHIIQSLINVNNEGIMEELAQVRAEILNDNSQNDDMFTRTIFKTFLDLIISSVRSSYNEEIVIFNSRHYLNNNENPHPSSNKEDVIEIQTNLQKDCLLQAHNYEQR
ncbi:hypothetical protein INT47_012972 [Mucor saturninus]|uniref:Uncharacterized protein n=1 Tax=Mucor saturninus TaxID=64648 RepID=A0A8H7QV70_9FUNG|nr:hypothetical protein INT47_012972 [Mucor saturninus]